MENKFFVKVCDICSREFETFFESKKHCSLECVNEKGRQYQRARAERLRELEEENKELKKQLQETVMSNDCKKCVCGRKDCPCFNCADCYEEANKQKQEATK